jgi:hypothetical protein
MSPDNRKLTGIGSDLPNTYINYAFAPDGNYSLVGEDGYGSKIDKYRHLFDGCIGSLQRNESDVAIINAILPIDGPNLTQGEVMSSGYLKLISSYQKASRITENDYLTTTLRILDKSVYGLLFLLTCLCSTALQLSLYIDRRWLMIFRPFRMLDRMREWPLIRIYRKIYATIDRDPIPLKTRLRRNFSLASQVTIASVVHQHSSYQINIKHSPTPNFCVFLITIVMFLSGFFMTSMIKTELVTIKPPQTIKSFQDALDANVHVKSLSGFGVERYLQSAPLGSTEHKIADRLDMLSIDMIAKDGHVFQYAKEFLNCKLVGLLDNTFAEGMHKGACGVLYQLSSDAMLNSLTPGGAGFGTMVRRVTDEYLTGFAFNSGLRPDIIRKINLGVTQIREAALELPVRRKISDQFAASWSFKAPIENVQDCMKSLIQLPNPKKGSLGYRNYFNLFRVILGMFCLAGLVCLYENIKKSKYQTPTIIITDCDK